MSKAPSYEPPSWSSLPSSRFYLEVLKDGSIASTIDLEKKAYFTLGRQPDLVDIVMDHPSISRLHAVLNFREDGALMLRDLGSAQGTQLNKQLCDKNTYYRVYVGDMIRFGASTRKYIVMGPEDQTREEYNSANMENYREKLKIRSAEIKQKLEKEEENNGFSWGMRDDAVEEETEEDNNEHDKELPDYLKKLKKDENFDRKYGDKFTAHIDESEAKNTKDTEILEKIRKKERKIQNMQEENRRIYMKEASQDGGLTDGQNAAVNRNDTALEVEIENLIKQIRAKAGDRALTSTGGQKRTVREDEDDDLLDLSAQTADSSTNWRLRKKLAKTAHLTGGGATTTTGTGTTQTSNDQTLSYTQIKQQLEEYNKTSMHLTEKISSLYEFIQVQESIIQNAKTDTATEGADQITAVVAEDRITESKAVLKKLQNEQDALRVQSQRLQVLLRVATPALSSLVRAVPTPTAVSTTPTDNVVVSTTTAPSSATPATTSSSLSVATATSRSTAPTSAASAGVPLKYSDEDGPTSSTNKLAALMNFIEEEKREQEEKEKEKMLKEAVLQQRQQQQAVASTKQVTAKGNVSSTDVIENTEILSKRQFAPVRPPLNKNTTTTTTTTGSTTSTNIERNQQFNDRILEGGEAAWVPPAKQTGDGKTSLNAKFGY